MERGTFVHNVLCAFYQDFQEKVALKVTAGNLPQAIEVLDESFAQQVEHDREREPGRRYVPVTPWEEQLLADLRQQLSASLENEAALLPHFHPAHLEWDYGVERPFSYAGCNLTGTIDRIDVDDAGNAVVIDYKTGNLSDYSLLASADQEAFALPHKMQTLIYAQVVRKTLGLNVVGALYYNPFAGVVRGAFDHRALGPLDLLDLRPSVAACNQIPVLGIDRFEALMDTCEQLVAKRIEALLAGDVDPAPLSDKVCAYCPVGICEKRPTEGSW